MITSFFQKSSLLFLIKLFGAALGFAGSIFLGRTLGIEAFGQFELVITIFNLVTVFAVLGSDAAVLRFVSQTQSLVRKLVYLGMGLRIRFLALSAVLLGAVGYVALGRVATGEFVPLSLTIMAAVLIAIPVVTRDAVGSFLVVHEKNVSAFLAGDIFSNLFRLLGFLLIFQFGILGVYSSVAVQGVVYCCSMVLMLLLMKRVFGVTTLRPANQVSPAFWSVAKNFWLVTMAWHLMIYMDVLMLAYFEGTAAVGGYSVCLKVLQVLNYFVIVNSMLVNPRVAKLYHAGDVPGIRRYINSVVITMLLVAVVIVVSLLFYGRDILALWGQEFGEYETVLFVLLVGQMTNMILGPHTALLGMTGNEHLLRRINVAMLPVNLLLNLLLIPQFGAIGAALSTAFTMTAINVLATVFGRFRVLSAASL